jgi:SAM-dependent methyltransferase
MKKPQESPAIQLIPGIDICSGDDGAVLQGAPGRRTRMAPSLRGSIVETLDGIATLGLHNFIAQQFSMPEGMCGRVTGGVMGLINHLPNRRAIELLEIAEQDDVLEMGFGPGWALKKMSKLARSGTITGVDRSPTMFRLAQARNRAAIEDGKLKLIQGSFEQLALESASVDKVLAVNVIYFCSPIGLPWRKPAGFCARAERCRSMRRIALL